MAKRIIEISVNDEYILGSGVVIGAAGSHDDVVLKIDFNESWIGMNIYATFRDALSGHPTVVLFMPSMLTDAESMIYEVTVPAAAKLYSGKAMLTLTGYTVSEDGTIEESATNTATAYFTVLPSDCTFAEDNSADATFAQQLQNEINNHRKDVNDELKTMQQALDADLYEHRTAVNNALIAQNQRIGDAVENAETAEQNALAALEIANEVKARADAGEFKGEQGEKGDAGMSDAEIKSYVDEKLGTAGVISFIPVTELPTENIAENAIYLVPAEDGAETDLFNEYIYANGTWEMIGSANVSVDLTEYVKNTDYASDTKAGVVKVNGACGMTVIDGLLVLDSADDTEISNKADVNAPLKPNNVDLIVKTGITANSIELTDAEKVAVHDWLGIINGENGADGEDGYTPVKGVDYFTDADKEELVAAVLAAISKYDGAVTVS